MNFFSCFIFKSIEPFLSWKYGRPLDFCLKCLLQLVNLFLFHPTVHTTVFCCCCFGLVFFFGGGRSLDICLKCLLKLVKIFLFHPKALRTFFFQSGNTVDLRLNLEGPLKIHDLFLFILKLIKSVFFFKLKLRLTSRLVLKVVCCCCYGGLESKEED